MVTELGKNRVEEGRPLQEVRRKQAREEGVDVSQNRTKNMSNKGSSVKNMPC